MAAVDAWDQVRQQSPQVSQVILAYTRDDVRRSNQLARGKMRAAGALHGADQVVQTERGERAFAAGDRIMFQKNERGLGGDARGCDGVAVKNGTLGTVLAVEAGGERLTVRLDGSGGAGAKAGAMVTFCTKDYAHLDHGYAATVHKAQGVTVDRAHVLATPHMDRHAAYVGLTRHRDGVTLHYGRDDFAEPARLARVLSRERAKDTTLDYDREDEVVRRYAERRGLAPNSQIVVRPPRVAEPEAAKAVPVPEVVLAETVAKGRAGFRERFEAHRRQQAQARDEAAARELVGQWDRLLTAYKAALPGLAADPALDGTRERLAQFGRSVREQPGAVRVLREQGEAFGMAARPNLARVLADREPEQVVARIMTKAEDGMRAQLKAAAEQEAVRQQQERARQAALRPRRGPFLGR